MSDLISREALMRFPIRIEHYDKENGNLDFVLGIESVLEYAENLPVVDAVESKHGRCLDCIHQCYTEPTEEACNFFIDKNKYVEVKHGRWVKIEGMAPPEYHGKHMCSICYARALERNFHEELSECCPHCGVRMDGEPKDGD